MNFTRAELQDYAWRLGRTFLAAFVASLAVALQQSIDVPALKAAVVAAAAAGLNAVLLVIQRPASLDKLAPKA